MTADQHLQAPLVNVGVVAAGLMDWSGGKDLLRLVLEALAAAQRSSDFNIHLLSPNTNKPWPSGLYPVPVLRAMAAGKAVSAAQEVYWAWSSRREKTRQQRADIQGVVGQKPRVRCWNYSVTGLAALAQIARLDFIVFCMRDLGPRFPVPWVGYLPDVQHKHLPELFSAQELQDRDDHFLAMVNHADCIAVTSNSVKRDIDTFFPAACNVDVLPFVSSPQPSWFEKDIEAVKKAYRISPDYFIVCNQFWQHKDHGTVFNALASLRQGTNFNAVELVCTGDTTDYRDKDYFSRLMAMLDELGLRKVVHILGRIPKVDQIALLRGARALVQPSRFEGTRGGLSVADAIGVGTPCIVSDIDVNREITDESIRFFAVGNQADLCLALQRFPARTKVPNPTVALANASRTLEPFGAALLLAGRTAQSGRLKQVRHKP